MKGLLLRDIGKINIEEIAKPEAGEGEVVVKVGACGICGSDIPRAYKDGAHNMPLVIGHEFAGVVDSVGYDVDKSWEGKRVGVFPLIPCMKCDCCKKRKYEMCSAYSYLGSRRDGGFAEYVAVPQWNLIELPENVTMEQAAMLEPMAVAVHAIRQVMPEIIENGATGFAEKNVVVMGLGTIGLLVVMFLLEMGVKNVYTIGNKDFQKKMVLELGISENRYFDGKNGDAVQWIMENTDEIGADVFFECIGKQESLNVGIGSAAPLGRVCTVGNPHSDMNLPRKTYWKILRSQLTLVGTWNSSFTHEADDDWHYVLDRLQQGDIHPEKLITHTYRLDDIIQGFEIMRDKKEEYVKIMGV